MDHIEVCLIAPDELLHFVLTLQTGAKILVITLPRLESRGYQYFVPMGLS